MSSAQPQQPWEEQFARTGRVFKLISELSSDADFATNEDVERALLERGDARSAAHVLRGHGFALCKPDAKEKKPTYKGWSAKSLEADDFAAGEPDTDSAAVKLPLVVFLHERILTAKFGDDPETAEGRVVLASRAALRELCSATTGRAWLAEESEGAA